MMFPPPSAPMIPVAAAFALGIAAAILIGLTASVVVCCGMVLICLLLRKKYLALLGVITCAGACQWTINEPEDNIVSTGCCNYSGTAEKIKDVVTSRIITLSIDSVDGNAIGSTKANIIIPSSNPLIEIGDRVSFGGVLTPAEVIKDLPDEISPAEANIKKGIFRSGVVLPDSVHSVTAEKGLLNSIRRWKNRLTDSLMGSNLSDSSKEFFAATLLGDTSLLDEERRNMYSASGLAHIIALSGLHVAIITFFAGIIMFPLRLLKAKWLYTTGLVMAFWLFAIMTGMASSVGRAAVMATVVAFGVILQRKSTPANSLALAAFVILMFKPSELLEPGFQMSFASVTGILMFYRHFRFGSKRSGILGGLGSLIAVSVAAMMGAALCVAFYFHNLPLLFLPANIIVIPVLLPITMGAGIIALMMSGLGMNIPSWLATATDHLTGMIDEISQLIGKIPFGVYETGELGTGTIISVITLLVVFKVWLVNKKPVWMGCVGLMGACCFVSCEELSLPTEGNEIYVVKRHSNSTEIVVRADQELYVMTTALDGDTAKIADGMRKRYGRYMRRRKINNLMIIPRYYESDDVKRDGNLLETRGSYIAVIGRDGLETINMLTGKHLKFVVIEPTFRGNEDEILSGLKCDSIVNLKKERVKKRRMEL